jgi:hypothetical protein
MPKMRKPELDQPTVDEIKLDFCASVLHPVNRPDHAPVRVLSDSRMRLHVVLEDRENALDRDASVEDASDRFDGALRILLPVRRLGDCRALAAFRPKAVCLRAVLVEAVGRKPLLAAATLLGLHAVRGGGTQNLPPAA